MPLAVGCVQKISINRIEVIRLILGGISPHLHWSTEV
jgi:hypothetical protein